MYVICQKFEVYVIVVLQVKFDIIVEVWWGNFIVFWQYYMIWIVSEGYKIIFFFVGILIILVMVRIGKSIISVNFKILQVNVLRCYW